MTHNINFINIQVWLFCPWKFVIYLHFSSTNKKGPWKEILDETLVDSRNQPNPVDLQSFSFEAVTAGFVKFEVLSWYGIGGGLQYFNIEKSGDKILSILTKEYKILSLNIIL